MDYGKYEKNHKTEKMKINKENKGTKWDSNLPSQKNRISIYSIFSGIDKITASWVCLSLRNGGIEVAQP